jgi:putative sterol carrier protein
MSNRPPADVTPKQFFEDWLPAQLASAGGFEPMKVRTLLDGDGGGTWEIAVGPKISVGAPSGGEADVTLMQTVADWRAIVAGEPGAVNLAPPQASPQDVLMIDPKAQKMLKDVKGTVRFEVTGFNGRTWQLTVKFGQQPMAIQPNATITVDAETYAGMLARTIPAPQAFFSGKIKLTGDTNLAMQLGMAMMSRF